MPPPSLRAGDKVLLKSGKTAIVRYVGVTKVRPLQQADKLVLVLVLVLVPPPHYTRSVGGMHER